MPILVLLSCIMLLLLSYINIILHQADVHIYNPAGRINSGETK